jgi:hypothetical protein
MSCAAPSGLSTNFDSSARDPTSKDAGHPEVLIRGTRADEWFNGAALETVELPNHGRVVRIVDAGELPERSPSISPIGTSSGSWD